MATLLELCDSESLVRLEVPLGPHDLIWRCLYGTPDFVRWLDEDLSNYDFDPLYANLSPLEQVGALFAEYVLGEPFASDRRFKKLKSTPDHFIWELKTEDVRIFGWVGSVRARGVISAPSTV